MSSTVKDLQKETFPVTGMTCAACASSVETILQYTEGVKKAQVNLAAETVNVEFDSNVSPESLNDALSAVGYGLILSAEPLEKSLADKKRKEYSKIKNRTIGAGIFTLPVFILGMFFMNWEPGKWISMILSLPVLFYFGSSFFSVAWKQAKIGKANMDTLVALGSGIAFLFSSFNTIFPEFWLERGLEPHVYFEASTIIIFFISIGKLLEARAKTKTGFAIQKLLELQPKKVSRINVDGNTEEIDLNEVAVKDTLLIRPGDKIPVDGSITNGESYVDESMISGEPIPVSKTLESKVYAGTINQDGSFRMIAEKVGADTLLSQIIKRVHEAQGSKAEIQKLTDKIAGIFVPIVLLISILTFFAWFVIAQENAFSFGLLSAISVLVIACPCALGLATPTAIMVGVGKGAEENILIKDADSLEIGSKIDTVILDKTGTITQGKPNVSSVIFSENFGGNSKDQSKWFSYLFALESNSKHPLANAIAKFSHTSENQNLKVSDFKNYTGFGIMGKIEETVYRIGSQKWITESEIQIPTNLINESEKLSSRGETVVWFANDKEVISIISISDPIKGSSKSAIEKMQNLGLEVIILSGDQENTTTRVAEETGIRKFKAGMLPQDKANYIKSLQSNGKKVAMIGDGINDSEALATADLSIAMGHGADIAIDSAMVTLTTSDLTKVVETLNLSKLTMSGIKQNLFWASVFNLIGIPIAAGVLFPLSGILLNPMVASAAMAMSSVSVVTNSLRLKGKSLN
ncbi:heavy metal translocating P-type ATPase [Algoriphagus sediminis]|uniref:Heavy metal translocating P-type ATPase n=1 Tax=Algoriphagus sediminis TaxID=3057113 RepID=A0ABT7YB88_9BACT|nr:heavy metal translocating P-type ATPase [Algoriphagus sediminis]MDN3203758.1 heavy metal translocating P-type ATPase [Algoriphagus sediminis]